MQEFSILPFLGQKTNVPQDDISLFKMVGENTAITHDTGGKNFDLLRQQNACSKSFGYKKWPASANSEAVRCHGLFELETPTSLDHIMFDNGKCFIFDSTFSPAKYEPSTEKTFANNNSDIYTVLRVGDYMIFTDNGKNVPYKWKKGDKYLTRLISSGIHYKFKYLGTFQRRVIGVHEMGENGSYSIRWSTAWPTTHIDNLSFPSENQLYMPNDDILTGVANMGYTRCFLYCMNSIHELIYYPDYYTPFKIFTIVAGEGCAGHHSVINLGNRHFLFNRNHGFCVYDGGKELVSISKDIDNLIQDIDSDFYSQINGTYYPYYKKAVWVIPLASGNQLWSYSTESGQWEIEDKNMVIVDSWNITDPFTWNDLITTAGGGGASWNSVKNNTWASYLTTRNRLVLAKTDGYVYYCTGDDLDGSDIVSYRIEPIMSFGNSKRKDLLKEIWFSFVGTGDFSIQIWHRMGNTVGEVTSSAWTALDSFSYTSPDKPVIYLSKSARLHQIKWGTSAANQNASINKITFKYESQEEY